MKKFFNTAGPCRPDKHYTVEPLSRLSGVRELINDEHYFVLHAPRQTGKTTYLYALMHQLNQEGQYTALTVNIQPAASGRDSEHAMRILARAIYDQATLYLPETEWPEQITTVQVDFSLREYLKKWVQKNQKPIVLFIDEADSLMDELFLALLHQLRAGFEARPKGFPHSIALVGLRDVRDYKIRLRPDHNSLGTGSPFNIKSKSLFMLGFTFEEVSTLLDEHTKATGQIFDELVKKKIYHLTAGQPWLTNALANQIVAEILHNDYRKTITLEHVTQAKEALIQRRDTHLDSLIDKLREPSVKPIVQAIINGELLGFDRLNDAISYTYDLGLITKTPPIRFANPIYQEIIPRVLSFDFQIGLPNQLVDPLWYIKEGRLDMNALLLAFQKFYRRHSEAWLEKYDFREAGRQLLLMAFLHRIVNAKGRIEREMAVGNGRCDLLVEYGDERQMIELKLYYDSETRQEGLDQAARYLSRLELEQGYLIIFETRVSIPWEKRIYREEIFIEGKKVILLGM
ncbi:MAG: AAA-like domain-containing protein [Pseudomonadota bacterium]